MIIQLVCLACKGGKDWLSVCPLFFLPFSIHLLRHKEDKKSCEICVKRRMLFTWTLSALFAISDGLAFITVWLCLPLLALGRVKMLEEWCRQNETLFGESWHMLLLKDVLWLLLVSVLIGPWVEVTFINYNPKSPISIVGVLLSWLMFSEQAVCIH